MPRRRRRISKKGAPSLPAEGRAYSNAINRPSFWAGAGLLLLAGAMATNGAIDLLSLSTGLGGALAIVME